MRVFQENTRLAEKKKGNYFLANSLPRNFFAPERSDDEFDDGGGGGGGGGAVSVFLPLVDNIWINSLLFIGVSPSSASASRKDRMATYNMNGEVTLKLVTRI